MSMRRQQYVAAYVFLAPALIGLVVFRIYPIFLSVIESFHQSFYGVAPIRMFVGFENFQNLFADVVFWISLRVTLVFQLLTTPSQIVLAFTLALLLLRPVRGRAFLWSLYLIPVGVSLPIATIIWGLMLNPGQGLVNGLLTTFGLPRQPFFTSASQSLLSVFFIASWSGVPFWMIFLMAGLRDIPQVYYEAARIDGANWLRELIHITIPLMRRPLLFVTVANTIANFLLFVPMYVLTRGGPQLSTNVLMYEAYRSGFVYQDLGRSMAIIVQLTIMILAVVAVQFKLLGIREEA